MREDGPGFATRAIHAGERTDPETRALNPPIYQTATFAFETAEEKEAAVEAGMAWEPGAFFYSRTANPTTAMLEEKLAALEGAEDAVVGASGMGACATALFSLLDAGDHCVAPTDLFVITRLLFDDVLAAKGIEVTHVDTTDLDAVRAAVRPTTRALFVETLSNPHMDVADLPALAAIAREHELAFLVDNTFLSPYALRPLEHGADLVLHSATKYLAGHGDVVAGVVAGRKELTDRVRFHLDTLGCAPSPLSSWLVMRGVRTLPLRMRAHSDNALAVARFLERRDEVELVLYPGLPSHPHHAVAERLFDGRYGGMLAMRLHGGEAALSAFARSVTLGAVAVSLGDVHTLVYPMPKRENIFRLSIGCEDVEDLLADFASALDQARAAT